jgi:CRISPR-associated protein Csb2
MSGAQHPSHALVVEVRLLTGRYHGVRDNGAADWPPAPLRLFQALVAGAYGGRWSAEDEAVKDAAFSWLEGLGPPVIAAPAVRAGAPINAFVPNNDLDAVGGDLGKVEKIRAAKTFRACIVQGDAPLLYVWGFDGADPGQQAYAAQIARLAERLHTLGWGLDAACACAEITDMQTAEDRLNGYPGAVRRPGRPGKSGDPLRPLPGTLVSLKRRHAELGTQFQQSGKKFLIARASKAYGAPVAYGATPRRLLFDLRRSDGGFAPQPLCAAAELVRSAQEAAVACLPEAAALIKGRRNGTEADKAARARLIPLPSIGHEHTDPSIRRLLVELPPACPLDARELAWALNGAELVMTLNGAESAPDCRLVPAADWSMVDHYGLNGGFSVWRTVTPAVLTYRPPKDGKIDGKIGANARSATAAAAAQAVRQALRHAATPGAAAAQITVRREPWSPKGETADRFRLPDRFAGRGVWHVEIILPRPVAGPLIIGDGRFVGLGLAAPERAPSPADRAAFDIPLPQRPPADQRGAVVEALRRALMSLDNRLHGGVATLFSGHEAGPGPARSGRHRHVFLSAAVENGVVARLYVFAPWVVERTLSPSQDERRRFAAVIAALSGLRAGPAGVFDLTPTAPEEERAAVWRAVTPYRPTRHPKTPAVAADFIAADARAECARRGLPAPQEVEVSGVRAHPGGGLCADVRLVFTVNAAGPILLGRDAHAGGGWFKPER